MQCPLDKHWKNKCIWNRLIKRQYGISPPWAGQLQPYNVYHYWTTECIPRGPLPGNTQTIPSYGETRPTSNWAHLKMCSKELTTWLLLTYIHILSIQLNVFWRILWVRYPPNSDKSGKVQRKCNMRLKRFKSLGFFKIAWKKLHYIKLNK